MSKRLVSFLIFICTCCVLSTSFSVNAEFPISSLINRGSGNYNTFSGFTCNLENTISSSIYTRYTRPILVNYELGDLTAKRIAASAVTGGAIGLALALAYDRNFGKDMAKGAVIGIIAIVLATVFD